MLFLKMRKKLRKGSHLSTHELMSGRPKPWTMAETSGLSRECSITLLDYCQ